MSATALHAATTPRGGSKHSGRQWQFRTDDAIGRSVCLSGSQAGRQAGEECGSLFGKNLDNFNFISIRRRVPLLLSCGGGLLLLLLDGGQNNTAAAPHPHQIDAHDDDDGSAVVGVGGTSK